MRKNKELVSIIKDLLEQNHQYSSDLAKAIGVSKSAMSYYLNGQREFPVNRLDDAADFLKTSVEYLLGLQDTASVPSKEFNFIDATVSAGLPSNVDPFTSDDMKKIPVAEEFLGKYKNADDLLMVKVAGDSMNRVFPDKSLIGVKKIDSIKDLKDGDIVVFSDSGDFCVKRIYINPKLKLVIFTPDSTDKNFFPITYQFSNMEEIKIWGKVVVYTVTIE